MVITTGSDGISDLGVNLTERGVLTHAKVLCALCALYLLADRRTRDHGMRTRVWQYLQVSVLKMFVEKVFI